MALKDKTLFLLDMDGTLYLGDRLFDGTNDFLAKIRKKGAKYLYLTNNSSKSAEAYVEKLARLGIEASPEEFFTSTDATILYIKEYYPNILFYCMGTVSFVRQLRESGIHVTETLEDGIGGILISNDQELTFKKLSDVSELLNRDIPYIATNPDWVCPTEFGSVPDCGSFAEMLAHVSGKQPHFIGKPNPDMILVAMNKLGKRPEETVMIGDRMYTDIASGVRAGVETVFVLSGEGTLKDAIASEEQPTYIRGSIKDILEEI